MIDPKFFNMVSQFAHALLGSTLVFGTLLLAPHYLPVVYAMFLTGTAVKEFWYDYRYEDAATRGSSLLDFACYQGGAVGAYLIYLIVPLPA